MRHLHSQCIQIQSQIHLDGTIIDPRAFHKLDRMAKMKMKQKIEINKFMTKVSFSVKIK